MFSIISGILLYKDKLSEELFTAILFFDLAATTLAIITYLVN